MILRSAVSVVVASLLVQQAVAQSCSPSQKCPESAPCCSQYGQCGVGAYCLGGCNPPSSYNLQSCMPAPICQNAVYNFNNTDMITPIPQYLGDPSKANFVSSGTAVPYTDSDGDQILLTMPANSVGTLLASTNYVWYGKVSARMKTSRTQGVVTAFIMLSDVKDEIDFEFVGADLNDAQSNFYYQAMPIYTNEKNLSVSDTFDDYHTYELDWTPDSLTWSIDGTAMRTLNRADCLNTTDNIYHYPQTPSRIQFSLWPAGASSNAPGTIQWAGGPINWDAPDIQQSGYFYAMLQQVTVECYSPPSGTTVTGSKSYVYTNTAGLSNDVSITDQNTILASLLDSGLNPTANNNTATSSAAGSSATDPSTVPGASTGGTGSNGQRGGGSSGNAGSSNGSPGTGPSIAGFSQNLVNGARSSRLEVASAFALVMAIGFATLLSV